MKGKDNLFVTIVVITTIMFGISANYLYWFVMYPEYLGGNIPIWEMKESGLGNSEYFIDINKQYLWREIDSIFYVSGIARGSLFVEEMEETWLAVNSRIVKNCKVSDGQIQWHMDQQEQDRHEYVHVYADVLEDTPLEIKISIRADDGSHSLNEYTLDETEESIRAFEEETGLDAEKYLDTIRLLREEYRADLIKLSKIQYRKAKVKVLKTLGNMSIIWGVWGLFSIVTLKWDMIYGLYMRKYEKKLDRYMKEFAEERQ
ncbi:MAG: hypothetical protein J1E61_01330 [Lachnospiraceae bacterium]|nr:hypothetical protein [Lachnospiraceae bacterium]